MIDFKRLRMMYAAGEVKRLHVVALLGEYPIARHVYGSLLIATELMSAENTPLDRWGGILSTLLYHDAPEVSTGDLPSPTIRALNLRGKLEVLECEFYERWKIAMPMLPEKEAQIVRAADLGDLAYYCLHEREMGNRLPELADIDGGQLGTSVYGVFRKVLEYMDTLPLQSAKHLAENLRASWHATNLTVTEVV